MKFLGILQCGQKIYTISKEPVSAFVRLLHGMRGSIIHRREKQVSEVDWQLWTKQNSIKNSKDLAECHRIFEELLEQFDQTNGIRPGDTIWGEI